MENTNVTPDDIRRLEGKVDKMANAVEKLILIEDRQSTQTSRLDKHDTAITAVESSVVRLHARIDKYTYLVTGASFVIMVFFELARFIFKA